MLWHDVCTTTPQLNAKAHIGPIVTLFEAARIEQSQTSLSRSIKTHLLANRGYRIVEL